jgi:ComF family protein
LTLKLPRRFFSQRVCTWVHASTHRALPDTCRLCGAFDAHPVCQACSTDVLRPIARCTQCALPVKHATTSCGQCLRETPPFTRTITLGDYAEPQSSLVTALKYRAELPLARWFARALTDALKQALSESERPNVLIPIPLAPRRLRQRGFNQSWEIAKIMATHLNCPAHAHILRRTRETTPQAGLRLRTRRANVNDAFQLTDGNAVRGLHIGLVDDVMTSGATIHAAALELLRHGAAQVTVLVALRTAPD